MMIRLGLIGCGWVSQFYGQSVANLADRCGWAWASDPDIAKAERFCAQWGGEARRDHHADADAYIIATPHHLHAPLYMDLVGRGKPVLIEKPLALTVAECDEMIAARDAAGTLLMVGYVSRYRIGSRTIKQQLDAGAIGEPMFADIHQFADQQPYVGGWLLKRETLGGGCFFSSVGHMVDLMSWLFGPIDRIQLATGKYRLHNMEGEDTAMAILQFTNGRLATICESWAAVVSTDFQMLNIYGSEGMLQLTFSPRDTVPHWHECPWDTTVTLLNRDGEATTLLRDTATFDFAGQIEHFIECIETGSSPLTDAESAREIIRVIRDAEANCRTMPSQE